VDTINRLLEQLNDLFRSMTIGARVTTALLLVAVVVASAYLFTGRTAGPEVDLLHGMPVPASHLQAMTAAFGKAKLTNFEIRGTQVFVPRGQEATYMAALAAERALPPNFGSAFNRLSNESGNPFVSSEERRERAKIALQEELALIIGRMPGIECASVIYATETKGGLNREKYTTASVSVKPIGDTQLDDNKVASIRHLVAGAVPGLKPENVTIADLNGRVYVGDSPDGGAENGLYLTLQGLHEKRLKEKILSALSYVPRVTVEPTVVLDREKHNRTREVQHDPKAVAWRISEKSSTHSRDAAGPAGRPGYAAQQANAPAAIAAARGTKEEGEESETETINLVGGKQVEKETIGLTPKRVSVAVGVPRSYFEKLWHERNNPEGDDSKKPNDADLRAIAQEEMNKIRKHVAGLLPPVEGVADAAELVTVTDFTDIKMPEPAGPGLGPQILQWLLEHWSTLGVIAVALVAMGMLRSLAKAVPQGSSEAALPLPSSAAGPKLAAGTAPGDAASGEEAASANRLRRFQTGKSLRDELSELVQEDPDVAANILKSWIGSSN